MSESETVSVENKPSLPSAYRGLLPLFDRLSHKARLTVSGHLQQMEPLIGSFDDLDTTNHGEFQGLSGLTQKGDLSQILQSELLLRSEVPIEFLRRLAEKETLFLEKEYSNPGSKPLYRVMISCGPGVLGHGRMIALSALFFFARLSEQKLGRFLWAFGPTRTSNAWTEGLTEDSLRRFLDAASFRDLDNSDIRTLHDNFPAHAFDENDNSSVDWIICEGDRLGKTHTAIELEYGRLLTYRMDPPEKEEPRQARIRIVKNGHVRRQARLTFPEDDVCVSALSKPFAPIRRSRPKAMANDHNDGTLPGWESQYFMSPNDGTFIVRFLEGVYIRRTDDRPVAERVSQSFWMPLPPRVNLVGVRVERERVFVVLQGDMDGEETLWSGSFLYSSDGPKDSSSTFLTPTRHSSKRVRCGHLFAKQSINALPAFNPSAVSNCFTSLGQAFRFGLTSDNSPTMFEILYKEGRIIYDDGVRHVLAQPASRARRTGSMLRLVRRDGRARTFHIAEKNIDARKLFGIAISPDSKHLIYSSSPGEWIIPPADKSGEKESQTLVTERTDNVVSIRRHGNVYKIWAWSDSAKGGDGTVRVENHREGELLSTGQLFDLNDIDGTVVKFGCVPGGSFWALAVDEDGVPETLVRCYRPNKRRDAKYKYTDIKAGVADAITLDTRGLFDA